MDISYYNSYNACVTLDLDNDDDEEEEDSAVA
jgi:hypothetical protein